MFKKFLFISLLAIITPAVACTTIIVGSKASVNGSVIIARNVDGSSPMDAEHVIVHPREENAPGAVYKSQMNEFHYPLPHISYKYSGIPDVGCNDHCFEEGGINENGVAISATESIYSSEKAYKADPFNWKSGIGENDINTVILPSSTSPRQAVKLLGKIIETQGASEGFGVAIADNKEAWYLETASGHHWVAERIPDESYFIAANQTRLQRVDLNDSQNFLGSPDLIDFAIKHHLYDPNSGEPFNFRRAYSRINKHDITYNYKRIWTVQHLFNPEFKNDFTKGNFPAFMKPAHLLSVTDVEHALQNHYQGTKNDPYTRNNPLTSFRPISVFRSQNSHIIELRPKLPPKIGNVMYVASSMGALSLYIPMYQGIEHTPMYYRVGNKNPDDSSAYWRYRKLQTLAMLNFPLYAPIIHKSQVAFEKSMHTKQQAMEKRYLMLYKKNPQQAQALLQKVNDELAQEGMNWCSTMINKLMALQTKMIEQKFPFGGA